MKSRISTIFGLVKLPWTPHATHGKLEVFVEDLACIITGETALVERINGQGGGFNDKLIPRMK